MIKQYLCDDLEIEIGLKPDGGRFVFCHDESGYAAVQAIVGIEFDHNNDWFISRIELEKYEYRNGKTRKVHTILSGELFREAKYFLERECAERIRDHVIDHGGPSQSMRAA